MQASEPCPGMAGRCHLHGAQCLATAEKGLRVQKGLHIIRLENYNITRVYIFPYGNARNTRGPKLSRIKYWSKVDQPWEATKASKPCTCRQNQGLLMYIYIHITYETAYALTAISPRHNAQLDATPFRCPRAIADALVAAIHIARVRPPTPHLPPHPPPPPGTYNLPLLLPASTRRRRAAQLAPPSINSQTFGPRTDNNNSW